MKDIKVSGDHLVSDGVLESGSLTASINTLNEVAEMLFDILILGDSVQSIRVFLNWEHAWS